MHKIRTSTKTHVCPTQLQYNKYNGENNNSDKITCGKNDELVNMWGPGGWKQTNTEHSPLGEISSINLKLTFD